MFKGICRHTSVCPEHGRKPEGGLGRHDIRR